MKFLSLRALMLGALLFVAAQAFAQFDDPRVDLNWYTIETEHFYVVYQQGAHRTAERIAKIAEEIYGPITDLYHHKPDQKVTFVVKDFADYSNGETNYYTNTIVIWANPLDFELRGTHNWLRNVISHEFTHDVQIQTAMKFNRKIPTIAMQYLGYENERRQDILSGYPNTIITLPISGSVEPAWYAEGVAQYMRPEFGYESWDSHRDMILRMYALDNKMLTWGEMSTFGKTSLGDESSYNQGFSMIRYIGQKYGDAKIREISYALSTIDRMTIDGAIEKALGITGQQLYDEWKKFLIGDYTTRVAGIQKHLVVGDTIESVGFGNFYPNFSADGSKILYISNKTSDYFAGLGFLYNTKEKKDSLIIAPVSGRPMWSPNDSLIVYAHRGHLDTHESSLYDLYTYNTLTAQENRLTNQFRAHSPAFSPGGMHIAYIVNGDGTENLWAQDIRADETGKTERAETETSSNAAFSAGKGGFHSNPFPPEKFMTRRQITFFQDGEQTYNPIYTADGKSIIFDYSMKDNRSIAIIDTDGKNFHILLSGNFDYRSAAFTPDNKRLYFACDSNGIFNIYSADWNPNEHTVNTATIKQITNVLGGAFYPAVDSAGNVAYALYTSTGYKLALLTKHAMDSLAGGVNIGQFNYQYEDTAFTVLSAKGHAEPIPAFIAVVDSAYYKPLDWQHLRNYNDADFQELPSSSYKSIFTNLFIIPILRVDTYNKYNQGLQNVKLGALFTSSDVTNRLTLIAGGMTNSNFEYDLFGVVTFHDRIPLLWEIGVTPELSLGIFNSQRNTNGNIPIPANTPNGLGVDTIQLPIGAVYNFLSFDVSATNHIFDAAQILYFDFNHTRYNVSINNFTDPQNNSLVSLPSDLYLYTDILTGSYQFKGILPSGTEEINPVGRLIDLSFAQNWNQVEDTTVVGDNGLPVRLYQSYSYVTTTLNWHEHIQLPFWTHTLSLTLHSDLMTGGGVGAFDSRAHALFDSYIGGLIGMEGYQYYALGGTRTTYLKAVYRFPISNHLDFRFLPIYFDKLYFDVFGDYGSAWNGSFTKSTWQNFKSDVGASIRVDAFMWYNVPMKLFFTAAYGLNEFNNTFYIANDQTPQTVTYGKQVLLYGGIGFDFPD